MSELANSHFEQLPLERFKEKISNRQNTANCCKNIEMRNFIQNFFQKTTNTIFGNAGFVQRQTLESVPESEFQRE
jgi:hypothetical protein